MSLVGQETAVLDLEVVHEAHQDLRKSATTLAILTLF